MNKNNDNELAKNLLDGVFFVDLERKITFWNRAAERISGYTADEAVDKICCDQMLECVNDAGQRLCEENCPLAAAMQDGSPREMNLFIHHKKGHRVPVTVRANPLRGEDSTINGCNETFVESYSQPLVLQELWQANEPTMTDHLVGIGNGRFFDISVNTRLYEFNTFSVGFGVILIDLDLFSVINTNHGNEAGNAVLIMIGKTLSGVLRKLDIVTRGKNDEFMIIVPNMPLDILYKVAERLRTLVKNSFFLADEEKIWVTASLGATLVLPGDTQASIMERLYRQVEQAKAQGRDRVVVG
jgi:diguanylate cyclase (GGDEF)-like protein/PAS domain S-box-containing protein